MGTAQGTGVVVACFGASLGHAKSQKLFALAGAERAGFGDPSEDCWETCGVQTARAVKASRALASLAPLDNVLAWGHAQPRCLTTVAPVKQGRDANDASTSSHVAFSAFKQVSAVVEGAQEAVPQAVPKHTVHAGAA